MPNDGPGEANARGLTLTGLTVGTVYTFEVRLSNENGNGPASATATATPCAAPNAPATFSAAVDTTQAGAVTLAWTEGGAVGCPNTGWEVRRSDDAGTTWGAWTAVAESAPEEDNEAGVTVTGLTGGTAYSFQARAVNAIGPGTASASASATACDVPAKPTLTAAAGSEQVTLGWTAGAGVGCPITSWDYRVVSGQAIPAATIWKPVPMSGPGGTNRAGYTVTELADNTKLLNDTTYTFDVRAVNVVGDGAASDAVTETPVEQVSVPRKPSAFVALPRDGGALLRWTTAGNGGRPIGRWSTASPPTAPSTPSCGRRCPTAPRTARTRRSTRSGASSTARCTASRCGR